MIKKLNIKITLILATVLRLLLMPWHIHSDVNATYWWGKFAAEFGFRGYYNWLNFGGHGKPDQPMLNIYYDWLVRLLYKQIYNVFWFLNTHIPAFPSKFMQWYFDYGNQILLKLPMILTDVLVIFLGYKFIKKTFNQNKANIFALVLALYPPLILNSAVWGSGDIIVNLFALIAVYYLFKKRYLLSFILFLTSVLYKSSLLIWSPLLLVMLIKNKPKLKSLVFPLMIILIIIYLICFPFTPIEINPLVWFYQTMTQKILPGIMDQMTANALNFWALIYTLKPKLDNFNIFGLINIRLFSFIFCFILYFYDLIHLYKNFTIKRLLLTLVNISLITFTFMTRMHERYNFPSLIPLFILTFYNEKYLKYFITLSITHFYNVLCSWFFPNILNFYPLVFIFSLTNVYILFKLLFQNYEDKKLLPTKVITTTTKKL